MLFFSCVSNVPSFECQKKNDTFIILFCGVGRRRTYAEKIEALGAVVVDVHEKSATRSLARRLLVVVVVVVAAALRSIVSLFFFVCLVCFFAVIVVAVVALVVAFLFIVGVVLGHVRSVELLAGCSFACAIRTGSSSGAEHASLARCEPLTRLVLDKLDERVVALVVDDERGHALDEALAHGQLGLGERG